MQTSIKPLRNAHIEDRSPAVPERWTERLEDLLRPLDKENGSKGRKGLASDIRDFVLNGEPLAVLSEVARRTEVGEHLRLIGYHYSRGERVLPDVYEDLAKVPTAVALRWAQVLEASIQSHAGALRIQLPRGTHWPEVLLMASAECSIIGWSSQRQQARDLSYRQIEAMLEEDGHEPAALIVACFATPVDVDYAAEQRLLMLTDLADYQDALARHVDAIRQHVLAGSVAQRIHVLSMLTPARNETLDTLAPQLCDLATANSKQVRTQAEPLVRRCNSAIFAPLRNLAAHGKPERRLNALRLLHDLALDHNADDEIAFARSAALADKAPSVLALVNEWDAAGTASSDARDDITVERPRIDWSAENCRIPKEALTRLWSQVTAAINRSNAERRNLQKRATGIGQSFVSSEEDSLAHKEAEALSTYLESGQPHPAETRTQRRTEWHYTSDALRALAETDGVSPAALMKVLIFFRVASDNDGLLIRQAIQSFEVTHQRTGRPTLLELSCMLDDVGLSGKSLLRNYCYSWGAAFAGEWPNEHVWPYFAYHLDAVLHQLVNHTIRDYAFARDGLFRALATLPKLPPKAINVLFSVALGPGKTDRQAAQAVLQNYVDLEARLIAALSDGKSETRVVAAQWLSRLGCKAAVPALERAVSKEKFDVVKGALLDALQALGQPVEKYLDRSVVAIDAAKSLAKGVPRDLDFFPWGALPAVRWADNASHVPHDVLRWLIVQAVKQKTPEPNAVLRKYCEMFEPHDREALGQFVLETWLREDVRPITPEEALQRAQADAQSWHHGMTSYPQYYQNSPHFGKSVEELTSAFLPALMRQPAGSANATKGMLAVAAACARERAAGVVQRYLKEWYGTRAAQGKALIATLAWIDHPTATQLMLAIGSRFRTKSFQEEATRQAEALAERKGWTLAELADRTVPSAGFDETGSQTLSFGARSFTARLLPDFKVELFNHDGKRIAALPEPRIDDDAELAKDAKKTLSNVKREIKSIVEMQTNRLYEAYCTERTWPSLDWDTYLLKHPVLRHLAQRLIWIEQVDAESTRVFRPLDDGTLTDIDDNTVILNANAHVRLAHESLLPANVASAWQQHLLDYEIKPLFQQLGKGTYSLPHAKANDEQIMDFEGHMLEAFALRGRALKLGYTRGAAEDGGWFHTYEKRFATLGLKAVIEFTGNPLPEENRSVALISLQFENTVETSHWQANKVALSKVHKVLLSECYNDLRLIAADGTGFDAQWRQKSEY